jgi:hypothetical protein
MYVNRALSVGALLVVGTLSASARQAVAPRHVAMNGAAPRTISGTLADIAEIDGTTLNSTNGVLANAHVRLRDARLGRVIDRQITDRHGMFAFRNLAPSDYIAELLSNDESETLVTSDLLILNGGDTAAVVLKLPFRISPFAAVLSTASPRAVALTIAAGASGVLATAVIAAEASPQ